MGEHDVHILYEDDWLIAVDKPAGIIVHGDGTGIATLTDLLIGDSPQLTGGLQALQRLDRETSGIVLFSKRKETQATFDALIAERRITKRYLAIVRGRFPQDPHTFRDPIGRDRHDSRRMRVSRTGKPSLTEARLLAFSPADAAGPARSLLSVDLHTGRKHQIRVHLSHAGFPILGDTLYGSPRIASACNGLMLHAAEERFEHPLTGETVRILAPCPSRFMPLFPCIASALPIPQ